MRIFVMATVMLCVLACAPAGSPTAESELLAGQTACPEQRSQMCTREYNPVCGSLVAGPKTYSNACVACADPEVSAWQAGACQ